MLVGQIYFEPQASIRHLRAERGGTRVLGSHLTSCSPNHGVGVLLLRAIHGMRSGRSEILLRRAVREVCTRLHLKHPWYIPVKLLGEWRAFVWACMLHWQGPALLDPIDYDPARRLSYNASDSVPGACLSASGSRIGTRFHCLFRTDSRCRDARGGVQRPIRMGSATAGRYTYRVLKNVARHPGVMAFAGCDTPEIAEESLQAVDPQERNLTRSSSLGGTSRAVFRDSGHADRNGVPCLVSSAKPRNLRDRTWWKRRLQHGGWFSNTQAA